jgi:ZIP family zinc transporter
MVLALVSAAVTFGSTLAGGVAALRWPRRKELLMALAGGVVLGAALFDLLPEAVAAAEDIGMAAKVPIGSVLVGYLVFHSVERYVHRHGEHAEHDGPDPAGTAGAVGFVLHSFFDGLAIGLGFHVDQALGIVVAAAVIGHDFSDGLNTVSYLVAHRHSPARSWRFLIADASAPLVGAVVGLFSPIPDEVLPVALGFFSGLFVYAAATNLLPASHALPVRQALPVTLAGAAAMLLISLAV